MNIQPIPTDKITPDLNQPRQIFNDEDIAKLAETFKKEGIISPIEITPDFRILVGERRWRAAQKAGLKEVPCIINEKNDYKNADRRLERQLIENEARTNLNVIDRAKAYQKYIDQGHSTTALADILGKSKQTISEILSLLSGRPVIQKQLQGDDENWTWYARVMDADMPQQKKDNICENIGKGYYKTRNEVEDVIYYVKNNPEVSKKIVEAKDETERSLVILGSKKSVLNTRQIPKQRTEEDTEKMKFAGMIQALNSINSSRVLWAMDDAVKIIKKYANKEQRKVIIESIETIIKVWTKTLKEFQE